MTQASEVKAELANLIKSLNMGFVKQRNSTMNGKTLIRLKALPGGECGPLTVTDAHIKRNIEVQNRLLRSFEGLGIEYEPQVSESRFARGMLDVKITVKIDSKNARVLTFTWFKHNTYATDMNLDPSYKTYWYVLQTENVKIK